MITARLPASFALVFALATTLVLAGCGASRPASPVPPPVPETNAGPLLELVPPSPPLVLFARPSALARSPAALAVWRTVVPELRERVFAERTGVDPLKVDELVAFQLPGEGYVLLVRGPFEAEDVVRRAGAQLMAADVSIDTPIMRREGPRGSGRHAYAALDSHAVLVARDAPPALLSAILSRVYDRAKANVLSAPDVRALWQEHQAQPLLVLAPKPLELEPGTAVALLLAGERALAAVVKPGDETVELRVDLRGEFPAGAVENFRALATNVGATPLGSAFGLAQAAEPMAGDATEQRVLLTLPFPTAQLVAGVKTVFFADTRDLLELAP